MNTARLKRANVLKVTLVVLVGALCSAIGLLVTVPSTDAQAQTSAPTGQVWAWGDNSRGQLGDGTNTDRSTPVQVSGLSGVLAIAGGDYQNLAIKFAYDFGNGSGGSFGEPVRDNELNELKAGASVPVKFGLGGDQGLDIFAKDADGSSYPKSKQITCPDGVPPDQVEETSTVSKSGLTYDVASGLYTYVWKTERGWNGTCRELNLKLADGKDHLVQFKFK